ncbi:MAG TPA: ATP-binding cassette domain-containing protein, partial [Clostridia bacterium]|nr:ATP-binding cassette domain-containing protein [Clostridia bacterium]
CADVCDAVLTKEFDLGGLVLSGGEYQKIVVARAFIKKGGIAILDEPSSNLDPAAEREVFQNLLNACRDKTVIFISHCLSSASLADRIYVMQAGTIAEHGTHDELIKKRGIYYDMFTKQKSVFKEA